MEILPLIDLTNLQSCEKVYDHTSIHNFEQLEMMSEAQ